MEEIYTNIYRESRKKAGLEQSEAEQSEGDSEVHGGDHLGCFHQSRC